MVTANRDVTAKSQILAVQYKGLAGDWHNVNVRGEDTGDAFVHFDEAPPFATAAALAAVVVAQPRWIFHGHVVQEEWLRIDADCTGEEAREILEITAIKGK